MAPERKKSKFFNLKNNEDSEESDASSSYCTEEEKEMGALTEI